MAELKINISNKDGKTVNKTVSEDVLKSLLNKKIGDKIKGEMIELTGYELEITGGSDAQGFPMRTDVEGTARKRILIHTGVGFHNKRKEGLRVRKSMAGNTVFRGTSQLNLIVVKMGKEDIFAPAQEAPAEQPAEASEAPATEE